MQLRRPRPEAGELPVSSMADIAFLLIIFFVSAALSATVGLLPLALPGKAATTNQVSPEQVVSLRLNQRGEVSLDGRPVPRNEITTRLASPRSRLCRLEVERATPYHLFVALLADVRGAGIERIAIRGRE